MAKIALTTVDNPYSPFTEFVNWFNYDNLNNYNTCGKLARLAVVASGLSETEQEKELERAIDEIIALDPLNIYTKIYENDEKRNTNEEKDNNEDR